MSTAQDITNKIWAMANQLRGTMDASEYRDYIFGYMFYRYLSERQEKYLLESEIIIPSKEQSVNEAYMTDASGEDLNDYLEEIAASLGYAIEPKFT